MLTFFAGVIVGGVGVLLWFCWAGRSDAPGYLADILKDDPTIKDRRQNS